MSTARFPRDDDDELPQTRQRGRVVPMEQTELIDIRVNGVTFGVIDPLTLKAKALIELERTTGALGLLRWCNRYGGVSDEPGPEGEPSDLDRLEDELGEMSLGSVVDLAQSIAEALGAAMKLPKARGRH